MSGFSRSAALFGLAAFSCVPASSTTLSAPSDGSAYVWRDSAVFRIPVTDSGAFSWGGPPPGHFDYLFTASWLDTMPYRERGVGWMIVADSGASRRSGSLRDALRAGRGVWVSYEQCGSLNCLRDIPERGLRARTGSGVVILTVGRSPSLDSLLAARPDSVTLSEEASTSSHRVAVTYVQAPEPPN